MYTDPYGLCDDPDKQECRSMASEVVDAAKEKIDQAVDKVAAGAAAVGNAISDTVSVAVSRLTTNLCPECVTGTPPAVGRPGASGLETKFVGNAKSGFTKHGIDQVINRGVAPGALLDAARNGTTRGPILDHLGRESFRIRGEVAEFAINLLGRVTTAWRR